ncbi:MAG: carboxylate--amine ligase [Firmicutes bacterium]|nr:carboxylate--amine ligase [Bacillota bacterium]
MNFEVVILGSDINAYYMARCCHEAYNKRAHLIAKEPMNFTRLSNILTIEYHPNLWDKEEFVAAINAYAKKHEEKTLLLIPSNDFYVRLLIENKKKLNQNCIFHAISEKLLNNLLVKDNFYSTFANSGLDLPNTLIFDCDSNQKLTKKDIKHFLFPIIVKPGDGVAYYKHKFPGQAKVYKLNSFEEVANVIKTIKKSGYTGKLIIQEFIPGGDDQLFDSIFYCDKNHKVKLVSFAQIGLQEHTHTGIGNCTVLVSGYNEHGDCTEQIEKMKKFLEKQKYCGFAEFDLKYDIRDHKYKVFEINPRQARSSYYLCACGFNLVKYLVDDLILNKNLDFNVINKKMVLSFVPVSVINKYVLNNDLKAEIKKLKRQKQFVDPLDYKKDNNFKRKIWLLIRKINYLKKYKNSEW